ncbi:MAG: tRNA (N6-isopentenyl adenosine(37)-C2)-methylthiotransferase MiaB [Treponematales bacterium]
MRFFIETFGCQMNTAESAALRLAAEERGWSEAAAAGDADLVLLNTCAVRETAERRALARLAHYGAEKRKRGRAFTLAAAGCVAARLGERLKEACPEVDFVAGAGARALFPRLLAEVERNGPGAPLPASLAEDAPEPFSFAGSHLESGKPLRAFVPVTHGCDNFCSYCVVPHVRGREVSRSPAAIVEEIRRAGEQGVREITLLGQNVNSYLWRGGGGEGGAPLDFAGLLALIAREREGSPVRWVRFLSSHPKDLSRKIIDTMAAHSCFCRHLHLPVQHGSNAVLARMNRRYTREDYLALAATLRSAMPGISLSTDILVGFPGETEADIDDTLALMEEARFLYAYTYHYNPREGTAAYDLPGRVPGAVKRERLARVIALQKRHTREHLEARLGEKTVVLVEKISRKNADEIVARSERDERAVVPGCAAMIGSFGEVTLSALRGNTFVSREITIC